MVYYNIEKISIKLDASEILAVLNDDSKLLEMIVVWNYEPE